MPNRTCGITGCDKPVKPRHSKCSMHVARIARHGDPHVSTPHAERALPRGDANFRWTGDDATYGAVHQRLRKSRGTAKGHPCEHCGAPARHWAYDRAAPDERTSPLGPYSLDLMHYLRLCVPCHKVFDLTALGKR